MDTLRKNNKHRKQIKIVIQQIAGWDRSQQVLVRESMLTLRPIFLCQILSDGGRKDSIVTDRNIRINTRVIFGFFFSWANFLLPPDVWLLLHLLHLLFLQNSSLSVDLEPTSLRSTANSSACWSWFIWRLIFRERSYRVTVYVFKRRDKYVGVVILMSKESNWGVWKRLNYWSMLRTNEWLSRLLAVCGLVLVRCFGWGAM